jgi:MFS family permease
LIVLVFHSRRAPAPRRVRGVVEPAPPLAESERARGRRLAIAGHAAGLPFAIAFTEQLPTLALLALGASEALIGLQSGLARALFVLQLPALRLVSRFSKRSLLLVGHCLALAASAPLVAFAHLQTLEPSLALGIVLSSLVLVALGVSLCELVWFPLLRGYVELDRIGRFFGTIRTTWHVTVIGFFLGGRFWLSQHPAGFGALFGVAWLLGAIRLPLIAGLPERSERSATRIRARDALALVRRNPRLRRYLLGATAFAALRTSVLPFALVLLRRELGFSDASVVATTVAVYLGGLVSLYLWGAVIDRVGAYPVFRAAALGSAALYGGLAFLDQAGAATLPAAVAFFFAQAVLVAGFGVADTRVLFELTPPESPAPTIVLSSVALGVACGLGPLLAGVVLDAALAAATDDLAVYRAFFLLGAGLQALTFLPLRAFRRVASTAAVPESC